MPTLKCLIDITRLHRGDRGSIERYAGHDTYDSPLPICSVFNVVSSGVSAIKSGFVARGGSICCHENSECEETDDLGRPKLIPDGL